LARRRRRWSPQTRRTLRRLALVGAGLCLLVGLAAGYRLFQAGRDLRAAQHLLTRAGDAIEAGKVGAARSLLDQATDRLGGAGRAMDGHVEVDALKVVPVLGSNVRSVRRSITLATQLTVGGSGILEAAEPLERPDGSIDVPLRGGTVPVATLAAVQQRVSALSASLPDDRELAEGGDLLVGPVKTMHHKVVDEVRARRSQLATLGDALGVLTDLGGGKGRRSYLIAVANSAEMRGSGGMILNFGGLTGDGGTFTLTDFARIDALALRQPVPARAVPGLPADYLRRWDGFDPLELWRNANLAADFTIDAPVLEAMAHAAAGASLDGVIQVDPAGLAELLRAVGPVEVPELGTIDADHLVPIVLNEAYVRYAGIEQRSDVLREVAEAAFHKLLTGQYDSLRTLGRSLVAATQGRHLMMHAVDPQTEAHLRALGADGSLPDVDGTPSVHLTVQNVSANKLDYFVDTELGLSGDVTQGTLRAEVLVHNDAPAGVSKPKYIFGPFDGNQQVGLYRGVVSLYLPRGTTLVTASGDAPRNPPIWVTEGGRPVVSWTIDLPAQGSSHVVLDLALPPASPDHPYELAVVPSPRVRPTLLRTDLVTAGPKIVESVKLDRTWRLEAGEPPREVVGPVDPPLQPLG
jgi:hypothetical protein